VTSDRLPLAERALVQLTLARVREFIREPEAMFWTFVFPIVISVVLAFAFPAAGDAPVVVGVPSGAGSGAIDAALRAAPSLTVRSLPPETLERSLRQGDVHIVVEPTTPPTYRFDPARAESRVARLAVDDALKRAAGRQDPWTAAERPQAIAGSRYIDWFIPGLIGIGLMSNGLWAVGFPITQARLRRLLKRMAASPMRRSDYLLAQMFARLLGIVPEVAVPLAVGIFAFGMPVNGSLLAVAFVGVLGGLSFAGLGLLVASRVRTFEAISGLMNIAMVPMWLLSGVFFSAANFPAVVQPFVQVLPLTAAVDALRAVILDGATLVEVGGELLLLGLWGVVPFAIALRIFKWQ
jgi:ABC-type multidrug transport system permease subunit